MPEPLSLGWATLTRYPILSVIPVIWEWITFWLMRNIIGPVQVGTSQSFTVKFLLPPSLPAGAELIGQGNNVSTHNVGLAPVLLGMIALLASAFVTAGYLHLLHGALRGIAPTWDQFTYGVSRFGGRLLQWHLLLGAAMVAAAFSILAIGPVAMLLLILLLIASIFFFLVEWLIVTHDLSLGEALRTSPNWVRDRFGALLPIALVSVALSAGFSLLLTGTGLRSILLASPLWGWFGTWLALAISAVVGEPQQV